MKTQIAKHSNAACLAALALFLGGPGCERQPDEPIAPQHVRDEDEDEHGKGEEPLTWLLAPHEGEGRLDHEIRHCQAQVREGKSPDAALERLGWLFVAKARESFDAGLYKLAEQCALALESRQPGSHEAMLLRGYALQNQHRFKEAEVLSRELAAKRGLPFDYGLLGDALMEQGKLGEAAEAYQKMINLRPDLHSYSRGAHLRWLKGDLAGATALMQAAVDASSPQDPEAAAWTHTRLALFHFQAGAAAEAGRTIDAVLALRPDYPPALLLRGRMLLAQDHGGAAAIEWLERAAKANPLPEYQWTLAEALCAAGREQEAAAVRERLRKNGAGADPRTLSLYLATQGEEAELAVRLAEEEFQQRQDIFTHDALAWALAAAGRLDEAQHHLARALAEGTADARLYLHAAVITAQAGNEEEASDWMVRAAGLAHLLLPIELERLQTIASSHRTLSAATTEATEAEQ